MPFFRHRLLLCGLFCSSSLLHADTLSFAQALQLAQKNTPTVRQANAQVRATQQSQIAAGQLPDPQLIVGIDNWPIEGQDAFALGDDFMTMRRVGVMQSFPNQRKREAARDGAHARLALANTLRRIALQRLRLAVAQSWLQRYSIEQQLALLPVIREQNALLLALLKARIAAGTARASDSLLPRQDNVQLSQLEDRLLAQRAQAIAQLQRWLGDVATRELDPQLPDWPIDSEQLHRNLHHHPDLASFAPRAQALDADVAAARTSLDSDWSIEVDYLKRGSAFDDMMMVQFRFDLPWFGATRQQPMLAAKQAERLALEDENEALQREHAAKLQTDLIEYQRLQRDEQRNHNDTLPLAQEKEELALRAWRSGEAGLDELIAARRERLAVQMDVIALQSERMQLAARLHFSYDVNTGEQR